MNLRLVIGKRRLRTGSLKGQSVRTVLVRTKLSPAGDALVYSTYHGELSAVPHLELPCTRPGMPT